MKSYFDEDKNEIIMIDDKQQSNTDANIISNDPLIRRFRFPSVFTNALYKSKVKIQLNIYASKCFNNCTIFFESVLNIIQWFKK